MKTTRRLTCINRLRFDRLGTLLQSGCRPLKQARSRALAWLLAIGLALSMTAWHAKKIDEKPNKIVPIIKLNYKIDYQIYALSKLRNITQFDCLVILWNRESQWSPTAKNGDHYGIPQGRSRWLRKQAPVTQIDWGIKYIGARYGYAGSTPNACAALAHSYAHWWY